MSGRSHALQGVSLAFLLGSLGECTLRLGHPHEADRHLQAALDGAETLENDELGLDARLAMARLAEERGRTDEARLWREAARKLRDSRKEALTAFRREMRPLWDQHFRDAPT